MGKEHPLQILAFILKGLNIHILCIRKQKETSVFNMSDSLLGNKRDTAVEAAASIGPENTRLQSEKMFPHEEDGMLPSISESNMSSADGGNLESESSYIDNNNDQEGEQVLESSSRRGISHRVRDDLQHLTENVTHGVTATPKLIRKGGTVTFQCFGRCFCNIPKKWPRSIPFSPTGLFFWSRGKLPLAQIRRLMVLFFPIRLELKCSRTSTSFRNHRVPLRVCHSTGFGM